MMNFMLFQSLINAGNIQTTSNDDDQRHVIDPAELFSGNLTNPSAVKKRQVELERKVEEVKKSVENPNTSKEIVSTKEKDSSSKET